MRGLSLFSGIGGLDLAFEWAGGEVIAMCEVNPYCRKILHKHWPDVPIFEDVREMKGEDVGAVDVIYGGFPCQPFSVAGLKKGKDDNRYLWPEFSRLVGELKPDWVVAENVSGILRIAADEVCFNLKSQGYEVGIYDFEAAAVGAPHRRERIFFKGAMKRETFEKKMKLEMPLSLNDQVAHLYPTPVAHDSTGVSPADYKRHSPPLGCYAGGSLNPEWVEWLMGYPTGWTELEH